MLHFRQSMMYSFIDNNLTQTKICYVHELHYLI